MKICPHNTRICSRYSSSLKKFAIFNSLFFPQEFRHQPQQTNPPAVHNTRCPYLIQVLNWFPFLIKWEPPKNMLYRATGPLAGSIRVSLHIRNMMDGVPSTALYTKLYTSYNTQYRSGIEVWYTCEFFCCMVLCVCFTVIYWQYEKKIVKNSYERERERQRHCCPWCNVIKTI